MSRLSRTSSAIRLAAARAVAGARTQDMTLTSTAALDVAAPSRREATLWRPCADAVSNADLNADFSNSALSNADASYGHAGASKQQHGDENKQGERELLLA